MASIAKFDEWQYTNGNKVNTVIQVVNTFVTERSTWGTSTTPNIITALNVSITPKFSTSKIIVFWQGTWEADNNTVFRVYKNGSLAPNGSNPNDTNYWSGHTNQPYDNNNDSTPANMAIHYVDNSVGSTSQTTYQIAVLNSSGSSSTLFLNRTWASTGTASYEVGTSSAIAMEIAQ